MSTSQNHHSTAVDSFDGLYKNLATAWERHQRLRSEFSDIADLALSAARLDEARADMWTWWKLHRIEGC